MSARASAGTPRVSVIVNCYNGAAFLKQALDSVRAQSFTGWELILWDDQSTDDSAAIATSYGEPRFKYFYAPRHTPLGEARDLAIRQASGDWLAFLDQDDLWSRDKLARQLALIDGTDGRDLGFVYGRTVRFTPRGAERDYDHCHEFAPLPEGDVFPALMRLGNFVAISSALVSRRAYEEIGGIPAGYQVAAEYYMLAALARGRTARALQEECARYREHGFNMSLGSRLRSHQEALSVLEQWSSAIDSRLYTRRRHEYQTLIGWEEIRAGHPARGITRILTKGSPGYLLSRPLARASRAARRLRQRRVAASRARVAISWHETRSRLRQDRERLRSMLATGLLPKALWLPLYPPYLCVWLHRLSHACSTRGHGRAARLFWQLNVLTTGADIHPDCDLGGGLVILNPVAAALFGRAGRNLTAMARAGIGSRLPRREDVGAGPGLPWLGDDVLLAPHSGVLGPVRVGSNVRLGAGCIVTSDLPDGSDVHPLSPPTEEPLATPSYGEARSVARGPIRWSEVRAQLDVDRRRLCALVGRAPHPLAASSLCVRLYRISHYLHRSERLGLASFFWQLNQALTGADIHPRSELGGGLVIPHPAGVSLDGSAGPNLTVLPLSGMCGDAEAGGRPELAEDVELGPQAAVFGAVHIGAGARLGAGAVLTRDVSPGAVIEAQAPRLLGRTSGAAGGGGSERCLELRHRELSSLRRDIGEDVRRYIEEWGVAEEAAGHPVKKLSALLTPAVLSLLLYRVAHLAHANRWTRAALLVSALNTLVYKLSISPSSCVAGGFFLPHPTGIVFHGHAGRGLALYSHALCVPRGLYRDDGEGHASMGDRVSFGVHSVALGRISLGDDVKLAFRTVLAQDAPSGCVVVSRAIRVRVGPADPGRTALRPAGRRGQP